MLRSKESKNYPSYEQILQTIENIKISLNSVLTAYWRHAHPEEELPPSKNYVKEINQLMTNDDMRKKRLAYLEELVDKDPIYLVIVQKEIMLLKSIPEVLAELAKFEK